MATEDQIKRRADKRARRAVAYERVGETLRARRAPLSGPLSDYYDALAELCEKRVAAERKTR